MSYETPFACVTTDHGLAAELVHVSPIFVRCGPRTRGAFAERRQARVRRSEARRAERHPSPAAPAVLDYNHRVAAF